MEGREFIYESYTFDRKLSDGEVLKIQRYLAEKYKIGGRWFLFKLRMKRLLARWFK